MNNSYNVWCKWHPLKVVVLGECYPTSFYRDIKNDKIKSALTRITEESLEDLEYFEKVLKEFGCQVLKPNIDKSLSIMDLIENKKTLRVPRSPLQPRDFQFVLGNKLYLHGKDSNGEFIDLFENYNKEDIDDYKNAGIDTSLKLSKEEFETWVGNNWVTYDEYVNNEYLNMDYLKEHIEIERILVLPDPPSCTLVGKDLYVDTIDKRTICTNVLKYYKRCHPNLRINTLHIGGHSDSCFHTLKPGAILSLNDIQHYDKTFPNWDVCYLPNQSWNLVNSFLRMREYNFGKWWVPGEEDNQEFIHFVETWLNDWVGYCEESVFDVNVLMLDEHHVCVSNYNEIAFNFFKKHKIEPIIVPWRHRYFWDGGLHCITLDLHREGTMEDYFPNRKKSVIDLGF